jgi:hypothetical protein
MPRTWPGLKDWLDKANGIFAERPRMETGAKVRVKEPIDGHLIDIEGREIREGQGTVRLRRDHKLVLIEDSAFGSIVRIMNGEKTGYVCRVPRGMLTPF